MADRDPEGALLDRRELAGSVGVDLCLRPCGPSSVDFVNQRRAGDVSGVDGDIARPVEAFVVQLDTRNVSGTTGPAPALPEMLGAAAKLHWDRAMLAK